MKKFLGLSSVFILLFSCSPKITTESRPLYEVLKQSELGGANFKFFEIITEQKEFKMMLNDPELKNKISQDDILTSNFLLLNMGEKNSGGYSITIENMEETDTDIIVTIKESTPKGLATTVMTYPMTIVKINSKKNIIIK